LMDACHRSPIIGERYRLLIAGAREHLSAGIEGDQRRGVVRPDVEPRKLDALITAIGLGVTAMLELGIPVNASELGETMLALVAPVRAARAKRLA